MTDIIVGSVARSYNKDKTDSDVYVKALGDKIAIKKELALSLSGRPPYGDFSSQFNCDYIVANSLCHVKMQ